MLDLDKCGKTLRGPTGFTAFRNNGENIDASSNSSSDTKNPPTTSSDLSFTDLQSGSTSSASADGSPLSVVEFSSSSIAAAPAQRLNSNIQTPQQQQNVDNLSEDFWANALGAARAVDGSLMTAYYKAYAV